MNAWKKSIMIQTIKTVCWFFLTTTRLKDLCYFIFSCVYFRSDTMILQINRDEWLISKRVWLLRITDFWFSRFSVFLNRQHFNRLSYGMHKQNFRKDSLFFSLSHTHFMCIYGLDVKSAPLRKRWSVGFCDFYVCVKFKEFTRFHEETKKSLGGGAVVCHCWGDRIESTHQ